MGTSPNGWKTRSMLYRVSIETRVRPIDWSQIWWPSVNFGLLFWGAKFFHNGYLAHFLLERDKIWQRLGLANRNLFPEFPELRSGDPVAQCGEMHQSFTGTLIKWFFDNFHMFADSFSVLSIYYVARGLGASFLYKSLASRSGSLRQHGLLVLFRSFSLLCCCSVW